jgi:hypothetical protein
MADRPAPLAIAFWTVGAYWAVAGLAYLCGVSTEFVIPLTVLGICTGTVELIMRRRA